MEQITLGQISAAVLFLTALIGGIILLVKWIRGIIVKVMQEELGPIKDQLQTVDLENCKNYLVTFLADIERGAKKDEIEKERFFEEYEHYKKNGGNGYIRNKAETLLAAGKL